jgi:adenosine kinase
LLGERSIILAAAGKDFGRYSEWLSRHNVDSSGVRIIEDEFTSGAYITTDMSDNQITGFNPGAMKWTSDYQFKNVDPQNSLAIVSPGNTEDMQIYTRKYKDLKIPYIFDPGQQIPVLSGKSISEMISGSAMLISNDYELDLIKKSTGLKDNDIYGMTRSIITTMGENGSVVVAENRKIKIKAVKADKVVDPTGAGDAYRAGVIKGLAMKKNLVEAAKMGATSASFAVECYGTQEHKFNLEKFWERFNENFG